VLFQAVFSCGIASSGAGVAMVADVGLVVRVVSIPVALDWVRPGAVVIASGKVAKVVIRNRLAIVHSRSGQRRLTHGTVQVE